MIVSKLRSGSTADASFPRLMQIKGGDLVVMMICDSQGFVVHPGSSEHNIGDTYSWLMDRFLDFNGVVELCS
jgi:hypothetical protein